MGDQADQAQTFLNNFLREIAVWVPKLIGAILILIIGYFIAKGVAAIVRRATERAKLKERLHTGQGGDVLQRAVPQPENLLGRITFWIIFLGALSLGFGSLGIPLVTDLIRGVYSYIPNVIAAVLIFLVASAVSAGISGFVGNVMGDTPTGKIVATGAPVLVMGLAVFMILDQLKIAPAIVTITYAALIGSVALGSALAFGLGGRGTAEHMLDGAYKKGRENAKTVKRDVRRGATRAADEADGIRP